MDGERMSGQVRTGNLVLVLLGALLVLAALKGLQWYSVDTSGANVADAGFTFTDLHSNADELEAAVASGYFDWLGWTLFVAAVVLAIGANIPTRLTTALRVAAFAAGGLGLAATYYALAQLFNAQQAAGGADHPVWHNASYGAYAVFVGFALLTVAGVRGAQRSATVAA